MTTRRSVEIESPLTDAELMEAEQRASALRAAWPRETMLRLIAELRRARAALDTTRGQPTEGSNPGARNADGNYTPPGGRVTIADWQAIAAKLEAERVPPREPRRLSRKEQEQRRRQWEELHAQLDSDDQPPLSPEEAAELDSLIREEIEAYRSEKRQARERDSSGH